MSNKPITVLSIEDDEFMKIFLRDVFWIHGTKEDIDFSVTDNIQKAKELMKQKKPDLILLDLMLPKGEVGEPRKDIGFDFLEEIKSNPETKDIKVIVFTGFGDKEIRERALQLGADKFLLKGEYLPKELLGVVKELTHKG